MNSNEPDRRDHAYLVVIGQSALLILSGLFLVAASILFAALMLAERNPSTQIVALLNAAMFYLFGMGIFSKITKTWKAADRARKELSDIGP